MLKKLVIEQFVIIDKLDLDLQPGLTVLTGETGAGKSILLDAVGLVLGDPANPSAIRQGSDQAVIQALFAPPAANPVWEFLASQGLASTSQKEFTVRRIMKREGKNDVLINSKDIDLDVLKKAGTYLTEIHGQFANQNLLDPSNQLTLLDLSGSFPPELFENVANALQNMHRYTREQAEEADFYRRNVSLISQMEATAAKIEATGLLESDFDAIRAEYTRLLTAYETSEAFQEITSHLIASNGAIKSLMSANMALTRQKNLDVEKIKNLLACLTGALQNARAAQEETARLAPDYNIDTTPLRQYKEKMQEIQKISQEIKVPVENLVPYCKDLVTNIRRIRNSATRMKELEELVQKSESDYRYHAHILTEKRVAAGKVLSDAINALLPPLKLLRAEFRVLVEERNAKESWTEQGFNTITFTARMNDGMPFSPIAETASGGELARLVLAVKVVLQRIQATPTLIFDEVDTGIGGSAAAAVGERIAQLAETTQVMVITHSPQVASRGDQHLHVSKKTDGVATTSVVKTLSLAERTDEISRMLAGDTITPESHAAAKKLIEEASAAARSRRKNLKKA